MNEWDTSLKRIRGGKKVEEGFTYTSDKNDVWLKNKDLTDWLKTFEKNKKPIEFYSTQSLDNDDKELVLEVLNSDYLTTDPRLKNSKTLLEAIVKMHSL